MSKLSLSDKIVAVDAALAAFPHAFGGAISLGYHAEPRGTIDIDVNVFVTADRAGQVLASLDRLGVETHDVVSAAERDGQIRVIWDGTPIDLFFSYHPLHAAAERAAVNVPFAGRTIRVLSATHLAVCKAVFDRPKDWVDIEAMLTQRTHIDAAEALRWVGRIVGDDDHRYRRLASLLSGQR
ncbi:hypothetical protein [Candidatus Poriferisodalis sp.]|uniref:hypothetical protein n=1 Tax=Candidatus Poriferisodalis sp. TaxID=3101277 RepID=UPI003B01B18B